MATTLKISPCRRARVEWLSRHLPEPADQREYARERCIVALTEALAAIMEEAEISRAELAKRLGVSKAHISQVLNGSRNMTLATIADVLWACGKEVTDLHVSDLGICILPESMIELDRVTASAQTDPGGLMAPPGLRMSTSPSPTAGVA